MSHFGIWILVILPLVFAAQNVLYVKKYKEESVDFSCDLEVGNISPVGFYLKRKYPEREMEVLFLSPGNPAAVLAAFNGRTQVHGDLSKRRLKVTLSSLSRNDSGVYVCEFVYEDNSDYRTIAGQVEHLLYVDEEEKSCSCPSYSFLLYAISGATALFLISSIGLGVALCCNARHSKKPPNPLPIYEEMTGLRPDKSKAPFGHLGPSCLEEVDNLTCDKSHIRLSQGNHYESPRRGLRPADNTGPHPADG